MRILTGSLAAAAVALAGAGGCRCSDDRPYTPFGVTSALPDALPSASAPPPPSAAASAEPPALEKSVLAPPKAKTWQLGGRELRAPPDLVFEQALVADFDQNQEEEAVAWLVPERADAVPSPPGELVLFPANGEPRTLGKLPDFVPTGPNCKLTTVLARTGPRSVTLDSTANCTGALIARSPVRALSIFAPAAERPRIQTLRVAAAAPDETLELAAVTNDRDGDGRDDVAITISAGHVNGPSFAAPLVFLDRAVGIARDPSEPRLTLERLAQQQLARSKTKKAADEVVRGVEGIRRLMSSVCAEGAVARVFDRDASALGCGDLGSVVDSLASAEIAAELARGAVREAFGALSRDGWYFGKTSGAVRKRLERAVLDAVEPLPAEVTRVVLRPMAAPAPHYSPLGFDTDGSLLVLTAEGAVRVGMDGTPLVAVSEGGTPLALDVTPNPGQRWQGVAHSCDRSETTLFFTQGAPLVTRLLAPRPGACGRSPFEGLPSPSAVCAGAGRLSALVGGSLVGECAGRHPGSARSPNGQWLAVPTAFGVLVDGPSHRLLNLGTAVERPLALAGCVAADDGRKAACLLKGQILLLKTNAL